MINFRSKIPVGRDFCQLLPTSANWTVSERVGLEIYGKPVEIGVVENDSHLPTGMVFCQLESPLTPQATPQALFDFVNVGRFFVGRTFCQLPANLDTTGLSAIFLDCTVDPYTYGIGNPRLEVLVNLYRFVGFWGFQTSKCCWFSDQRRRTQNYHSTGEIISE